MTSVSGLIARPNRHGPPSDASLLPLTPAAEAMQVVPTGIPRIIHQTYSTAALPDALRQATRRVRELNPDWDYRFYDDRDVERFIQRQYPRAVLDCYRRIDPHYGAARADLFRYLVIYHTGGVYLDVKTRALRPFDEVLRTDDAFVTAHWGGPFSQFGQHPELAWLPAGEFQQWHLIAAPRHPLLEAVIRRVLHNLEHYNPFRFGVGKMGVVRLTGPIAYTEAISPLLTHYAHRIATSETALGLCYSVFADGVQHKAHFPSHYSRLHTPIVPVPTVIERAFGALLRAKSWWCTGREQVYRLYRWLRGRQPPTFDPPIAPADVTSASDRG